MLDVELAVLLFGITLAVQVVGWIGTDTLADVVSLGNPPSSASPHTADLSSYSYRRTLPFPSYLDQRRRKNLVR